MTDADKAAAEMVRDALRFRALMGMVVSVNPVPKMPEGMKMFDISISATSTPREANVWLKETRDKVVALLDAVIDA